MSDFNWKTPAEVIRLQRLKQKQRDLHMRTSFSPSFNIVTAAETYSNNKRKNPFVDKRSSVGLKRPKSSPISYEAKDSIFSLIGEYQNSNIAGVTPIATSTSKSPKKDDATTSLTIFATEIADKPKLQLNIKYVPVDWSLKTKLRILCPTGIEGNCLKLSGASGVTSFVRCIDPTTASTGLDISLGARFHHGTLYWQHPNLPWLTLFPRNALENSSASVIGEVERSALNKDWVESFQSLFQLLRARHCPYFYCCANSFTVLFRAAGISGRAETHAFLTPTTSGFRAALKQENIEFSMPIKAAADRSNPETENQNENVSLEAITQDSGCIDELDDNCYEDNQEEWLASMGVDAAEIKKIRTVHSRLKLNDESEEDYSDQSIAMFEGVECQALFNFLMNAKSTTATIGRLAGVPPTLLAPVAFRGATLRNVQVNSGKVRVDNKDYHSLELKGVILPHIMQYLCNILRETKDVFSISTTNQPSTMSFSKAAHLLNEELMKENHQVSDQVFGQRNLSDCGLTDPILETLCRVSDDAVKNIEGICYSKDEGGYTWN